MLSFTKFILTHIFHVFKYIKNENNNFIKGLYKVQFNARKKSNEKSIFISITNAHCIMLFTGWVDVLLEVGFILMHR